MLSLLLPAPERAFNVASAASTLGARFDAGGVLDTGAIEVAAFAPDGTPLVPDGLGFRRGYWLEYTSALDAAHVTGHLCAVALSRDGDERLVTSWQLQIENRTAQPIETGLLVRAAPGPTHDGPRPRPAMPSSDEESFAWADGLLTRAGRAVLRVEGPAPDVALEARPAGPGAAAAELRWTLSLEPGRSERIVLHAAGAPATPTVAEDAWREAFTATTFTLAFERNNWQAAHQGEVLRFQWGDPRVTNLVAASLLHARGASAFQYSAVELSNRPYGHEATNAAAVAQMLGMFSEWGFGQNAEARIDEACGRAVEDGDSLDAAGRVALVHGLACAIRVRKFDEFAPPLADAIRAHVQADAPVPAWLDPRLVRADLQDIVERAVAFDPEREAFEVPRLAWARGLDPASVRGRLASVRRALSDGDPEGAWTSYAALLDDHPEGIGALDPADEYDARFSVAMLSLLRAMVLDDHGERLRLLTATPAALVNEDGPLGGAFLPTRFGRVRFQFFASGRKAWTVDVVPQLVRGPDELVVGVPGGEPPGPTRDLKKVRTRVEDGLVVAEITDAPGAEVVFSILRGRS